MAHNAEYNARLSIPTACLSILSVLAGLSIDFRKI
jgi:hypothetical protein